MKKLLLLTALLPCLATAQPPPPVEATTTQVGAGTLGYPFVVTPRGLLGFSPIYTNIAASTLTNVAQGISDTTSNSIFGFFGTKTNLVVFSGSNGPVVVGQAFVVIGTNATGAVVVKGTNWPTGGSGTGTLMPPNAFGVLTNNNAGGTNWSTSITGAWIGTGSLPRTAADSTWASATNYPASTNSPIGTLNQVPLATGGSNTFGSPTFNWGTLPITALSTSVHTNAFTNNIVGYITLTNDNGFVFQVLVGTNLP